MKYLNTYKLFEKRLQDQLVETLEDILLEVTDIGYKVETQWYSSDDGFGYIYNPYISIEPDKINVDFEISDIEGVIERIKEVCKDRSINTQGWKLEIDYGESEGKLDNKQYSYCVIYFY